MRNFIDCVPHNSPVTVVKSKNRRWTDHIARIGQKIKTYTILSRKTGLVELPSGT